MSWRRLLNRVQPHESYQVFWRLQCLILRVPVVLVTHIGDRIQSRSGANLRIDGIEARGLDENLELIVDRTPKRDLLARSTPELIVRRLAARSQGPASELFNQLADRFTD